MLVDESGVVEVEMRRYKKKPGELILLKSDRADAVSVLDGGSRIFSLFATSASQSRVSSKKAR